jgi:hypothetical protein
VYPQKTKLEANLPLAEGRTCDAEVRTKDILVQNDALKTENMYLKEESSSDLVANTNVLTKVVQEKQWIWKCWL